MRKVTLTLLAAAAIVPTAYAATTEVKVKDNFFKPDRVEINKGDKVTWRWKGSNIHNVALKKPDRRRIAVRSEYKTEGKFTHKFRRVGTWRVLCETHPRNMRMKVVVNP